MHPRFNREAPFLDFLGERVIFKAEHEIFKCHC